MKVEDFFEFAEKQFAIEMKIMREKGEEYTRSNEDKLENFKVIGRDLGISPVMVCMVYLKKHQMSIDNFVKTGAIVSNESIDGRINDERNYQLLLLALIKEERSEL